MPTRESVNISKKELYNFIKWFNDIYGYYPIIIGGWAVYYYNPYYGSRDIDVVFEGSLSTYEKQLTQYFQTNGYVESITDKWGHMKYRKKITTTLGIEFIDIDPLNVSIKNSFHMNTEKELPFSLSKIKYNTVRIEDEPPLEYRAPRIELLLLYKIKAYSDRDFELKKTTETKEMQHYTSKRDKDGADILSLIDTNNCREVINIRHCSDLIMKYNISSEIQLAFDDALNNPSSQSWYGKLDKNKIKELKTKFWE